MGASGKNGEPKPSKREAERSVEQVSRELADAARAAGMSKEQLKKLGEDIANQIREMGVE